MSREGMSAGWPRALSGRFPGVSLEFEMNKRFRYIRPAVLGSSLVALSGAALADVPAAVTDALTEAATDVGTMAAALVAIAVVGVGFLLGIKFVKKAVRAA